MRYVPFLAPPRPRSYGSWGAWAAPALAARCARCAGSFPYDLVHAHYAVPAADAVLRAHARAPLVVSVHGGDVYFTAPRLPAGERAVRRAFGAARLVLANSAGIEDEARRLGARTTRVVHLGTDVPEQPAPRSADPTLVTVAHLVARKRHADVVRALWLLRERHPQLRYLIVGDGPEREALARLAGELGVADRVELTGQLPHEEALARAREGTSSSCPASTRPLASPTSRRWPPGCRRSARAARPARRRSRRRRWAALVPPADVEALAAELDALLAEPGYLLELGGPRPRHGVRRLHLGAVRRATVQAYEDALR